MISAMVLAAAEKEPFFLDRITSGGVIVGLIVLAVAVAALALDMFVGPKFWLEVVWFFGALFGVVTLARAILGI